MKIAILISGHVRNFKKNVENFHKLFISNLKECGHKYDIFISTWDVDGIKKDGNPFSTKLTKNVIDKDELFDDLKKAYNTKHIEIENANNYKICSKHINDIFTKYPNLKKKVTKQHIEGVLCQVYKIKKAYELIKNVNEYDVIIKYRFDLKINKKIDWSNKNIVDILTNSIYLYTKYKNNFDNSYHWSDLVIPGKSEYMKYISNAYDYIINTNLEILSEDCDMFDINNIVYGIFKYFKISNKLYLEHIDSYLLNNYELQRNW